MSIQEFDRVWVTELVFAVDVATQGILDAMGDVEACLGAQPSDLVGLPLFASVHRDDYGAAQQAFDDVVANGRATWRGRVFRTDGSIANYSWEGRLGLDGRTIYARSRDIDRVNEVFADLRAYERLGDLTADLFLIVDRFGNICRANRALHLAHGVDPSTSVVGLHLGEFLTSEGRSVLGDIARRFDDGESVVHFQVPALHRDGHELVLEGTATFDEETDRWFVVERDVTDRVARQNELEITTRFFDLSPSELVLVDADDRIIRANPAFVALSGESLSALTGKSVAEVLRVVEVGALRRLIEAVRSGGDVDPITVRVRSGLEERHMEIHGASSQEDGVVHLSCRDVTGERRLQSELMRRATHDALTGLLNRDGLVAAVEADLAGGQHVALMLLDLDGFKAVNDNLGHQAGDELLTGVAERLQRQTRGVDVVARYGGDEFILMLRGVPDLPTVGLVCKKILDAIEQPFDLEGRIVSISASIGGAFGHRSSHGTEDLVRQADVAAYAAKNSGGGTWRLFDAELGTQADFAKALEEHLRRVLAAPDFELDVIETCDLDGSTRGIGVIAPAIAISGQRRWNPASLDVARRLGLLLPLSARLVEESIRSLAPWLAEHPDTCLELVLSVAEVSTGGLAPLLLSSLETYGVPASQLVVSLAWESGTGIAGIDRESLRRLREAGVRIALADTGAGPDTLSLLDTRLIDRIDVDPIKLAAASDGSIAQLIAGTVFDVADRLGVEIVIDASFTPDVVDVVSMLGTCVPVGVTYRPPVPLHEFVSGSHAV